jgi:hypothetical protein
LAENEREDSRQRVKAIEVTVQQMEQAYVDGERKRQELQHAMDSMFSRSAYISLYRNHEKKKILLARLESQLRFKVMMSDASPQNSGCLSGPPIKQVDKVMKKVVSALSPGKRNAVIAHKISEDVPAGNKVFNSLGEGRDLPRYLRSSSPVHHRFLKLTETRTLIHQFWTQVGSASDASSGAGIHDFLNLFFGKMAGDTDNVSLAYSLIAAAQQYSEDDVLIKLFWNTWNGEFR